MESWWKSSFSKKTQKHVFCALSLNISYKIRFFFGEKILVALDTYAKKMNPPSIVLGGGVHGKSCWLIAYYVWPFFSLSELYFLHVGGIFGGLLPTPRNDTKNTCWKRPL